MDTGMGMFLLFLIGVILPLAIMLLIVVGWLIKFFGNLDPESYLWRPLIKWGGLVIVILILELIFVIIFG